MYDDGLTLSRRRRWSFASAALSTTLLITGHPCLWLICPEPLWVEAPATPQPEVWPGQCSGSRFVQDRALEPAAEAVLRVEGLGTNALSVLVLPWVQTRGGSAPAWAGTADLWLPWAQVPEPSSNLGLAMSPTGQVWWQGRCPLASDVAPRPSRSHLEWDVITGKSWGPEFRV